VHDPASALEEYEILKNLDPYAAHVLHEIIETKGNIPPDTLVSYPEVAKEEMKQAETTITSPGEVSLPAVPAPQKEGLRSQTADASVKELISSDKIAETANTSIQETPRQSEQILKKDMYSVQMNVFDNKKNALSLTKRLREKGYNTFFKEEYNNKQHARYRVLVGRFAERAEAVKQAQTILKKEKLKSIIFKH
jgi:cell division septation protein DedD